jgi:mono/diheme cytochrome c family protein
VKGQYRLAGYVLLPVVAATVAGAGYFAIRQPASRPASAIKVVSTLERVERGRYLFESLADCAGCHSPRNHDLYTMPVVAGKSGAGMVFPPELGLPGRVSAPNLTNDPDTGLGRWTDGEIIRAIREGVSRDGRALFPFMPYRSYAVMSDEDVESVVAYLRSLPAVRNSLPVTQLDFPLPWLIKGSPQPVKAVVPAPDTSDSVKYGEYLVRLGGCVQCHTPEQDGEPIEGHEFAGGNIFRLGRFEVRSANITPDEDSGIGRWDEARFVAKFRGYSNFTTHNLPRSNQANFTLMPWTALSRLTDTDLRSIFAFLRTVKPVYHPVEIHPAVPQS